MTMTRPIGFLAISVLVIATIAASCSLFHPNSQQQAQTIEPVLAAASFDVWMADTPEKLAHLQQMPAMRLVPHRQNGKLYYGFADPYVCKCLYVGSAEDYAQYQKLKGEQAVATTESTTRLLDAEAESADTVGTSYWGPFGPFE